MDSHRLFKYKKGLQYRKTVGNIFSRSPRKAGIWCQYSGTRQRALETLSSMDVKGNTILKSIFWLYVIITVLRQTGCFKVNAKSTSKVTIMTRHNSFSFFPLVQNLWSRKNRNKKWSFTYSQIARLRRSLWGGACLSRITSPSKPGSQTHWKVSIKSTHVPWTQGEPAHSSTSSSHREPAGVRPK